MFLREIQGRLNRAMVEQTRRHMNPYEAVADSELRRLVNEFAERFLQRRNRGGVRPQLGAKDPRRTSRSC